MPKVAISGRRPVNEDELLTVITECHSDFVLRERSSNQRDVDMAESWYSTSIIEGLPEASWFHQSGLGLRLTVEASGSRMSSVLA